MQDPCITAAWGRTQSTGGTSPAKAGAAQAGVMRVPIQASRIRLGMCPHLRLRRAGPTPGRGEEPEEVP